MIPIQGQGTRKAGRGLREFRGEGQGRVHITVVIIVVRLLRGKQKR